LTSFTFSLAAVAIVVLTLSVRVDGRKEALTRKGSKYLSNRVFNSSDSPNWSMEVLIRSTNSHTSKLKLTEAVRRSEYVANG
jgi:hypothetical protein